MPQTDKDKDTARKCAELAEAISDNYWRLYKRGTTDARGDPYYQGMADGAGNVAVAIREQFGLEEVTIVDTIADTIGDREQKA